MDQLTFWSEEHLASLSPSRDFGEDLMTLAETSCSLTELLRIVSSHGGLSGRTCPASCRLTEDGILAPFSGSWASSGMGSPTEFLTLSTPDWPSDGAVCSLSDILETGDLPRRFYLSPKACAGILRRAEKRGKELPAALAEVLTACRAKGGTGHGDFESETFVAFPANLSGTQRARTEDLSPSMGAKNPTAVAIRTANTNANGHGVAEEVAHTLDQAQGQAIVQPAAVRRLTPRESERLQGFPDDYTAIPWRGRAAEDCPDGPRYKALGNSMAVPVMAWIGRRIEKIEAMMAGKA